MTIDKLSICLNDVRYPERLKQIWHDMRAGKLPQQLDMIGNINLLKQNAIGFCGSRQISNEGAKLTQKFATITAQKGFCIISGNATGADMHAHIHSLKAGGTTILIIAEGINNFYIRKNLKNVWDWNRTLVISQFNENAQWKGYQAMMRNTMIIALSKAMIVCESGITGGTYQTAQKTLKSSMPLFIAKHKMMSEGNQWLLKQEGARPLYYEEHENNLNEVFTIAQQNTPISRQFKLL